MFWLLLTALHFLVSNRNVEGRCTSPATTEQFHDVTTGELGVVYCRIPSAFWDDRIAASVIECDRRGEWSTYPDTGCNLPAGDSQPSCDMSLTPPENAEEVPKSVGAEHVKIYRCLNGFAWLSGAEIQVIYCAGQPGWSPVLDLCSEACEYPRDCTYLTERSIVEPGSYNIVPSGVIKYGIVSTYCSLSDNPAETGWTLGMNHKTKDGQTTTGLSVQDIADLSNHYDSLVMKIIMETPEGQYTMIYGNVEVDPDNLELRELGVAHGMAGDALRQYIGTAPMDLGGVSWWGSTSGDVFAYLLPDGGINWSTLKLAVSSVRILFRPKIFDKDVTCPPILTPAPSWETSTIVNISSSRDVGSEISFECNSGYTAGSDQVNFGRITCNRADSGKFYWSDSLYLPCELMPPAPFFVKSSSSDVFYYFSNDTAGSFLEASLKCNEYSSSLAAFTTVDNFHHAQPGVFYYTSHHMRVPATLTTSPPIPLTSTCSANSSSCLISAEAPCVLYSQDGVYQTESCKTQQNFICQYLAYCPADFIEMNGQCFHYLTPPSEVTILNAYLSCLEFGAGLVIPNNTATLNDIFKKVEPPVDFQFFLGLQDVQPNWKGGGLYSPDPTFTESIDTDEDNHWILCTRGSDQEIECTAASMTSVATNAICQYPSAVECNTDPVNATANMTREWEEVYVPATVVTYKCLPGYFVGGNISMVEQTSLCLGQLGEWYPATIQDCYKVEVCLEKITGATAEMTNVTDDQLAYLGGSATYYCPKGMAALGGLENQTVVCAANADGKFAFEPEAVQPCNICILEPSTANTTSDYAASTVYEIGGQVLFECLDDHHMSPGLTAMAVNCTSLGWQTAPPCIEACVSDAPTAGLGMTLNTVITGSIGEVLTYVCSQPDTYIQTLDGPISSIEITCSPDYSWAPTDQVMDCFEVCHEDPYSPDSPVTTNWNGITRAVGSEVNFSCPIDHVFSNKEETITTKCGDDLKWTAVKEGDMTCLLVVIAPSLPSGDFVFSGNDSPFVEGQVITISCPDGMATTKGETSTTLTATAYGFPLVDADFVCHNVCTVDPVIPPPTVTSSWDSVDKTVGHEIEYTCQVGELFKDKTDLITSKCETDWTWTAVDTSILDCIDVVSAEPPSFPGNTTFAGADAPFLVGQVITISCLPGMYSLARTNFTTIIALPNLTWSEIDPEFTCLNVLHEDPPYPPFGIFIVENIPPYVIGSVLNYTCIPGWIPVAEPSMIFTATAEGWSPPLPHNFFWCLDPNASIPPPTTEPPFRFPDANVLENGYDKTTAVHMPSLEHFLTNANEDAPEFMLTAGPFGFGYAVALNSGDRQCLMRKNYAVSDDCSHNPKDCTTGFSMSIWERLNISFDVFHTIHKYHEDEKRYVLSTGGDHNGHPGVSIYHQGLYLIAVVSTGDEYWEVKVLGPVAINEWNNIGIRWIKGDGSSGGLELYVNARKVGQVHEGKSAVAKAELAPTELLIGCHRDADDAVYRHYNDADFDEFALWTEWLDDEETIYFLGGYEGESENLDPEEFAVMLERTNLRDPEQAAIAMAMFNGMADQLKDKNNTTGEEGNSTELNEGAKKLKGLADAFAQLTNPHLIKRDLTLEELESYAAIIDAASKMFDESLETDWDDIEATGHRGSIGVKKDLEEYIKTICKKLKFDGQPLNFTRTTDNIAVKIDKMTVSDFKGLGKFYITPNFRESKQMLSLQSAWDLPSDKVEVPTDVISDPRCRDHPISVATAYYDTFDDVGPSTINPEEMNAMVDNEVDSRVISVDIVSDATDLASPSTCEPEKKKLEKNPLFITKEHKMKNFTQRSLKFHEGENTSPIYRRICVWWNYTIGVQGAWDATGCSLLVTNQFFSKCACAHSGTFSIIAEYLEEREVMEEPYWATVVKYIGHILSAICIVFYVLVVGLSGDLKDQFHISGVFLALSVLGGGIALLISDSDRIRDGRHSCTAIGSLIHALYLNAAAWVAMIGHAGFKAVTGGIIGGFMNPYIMISSGVTLVSVGFTYLFFIFDLGTDPRCFISWFNEIKFLFFFPVLAYAMAGIFFNCVIYFNTSHASKTKKLIMHDYGNFALGSTFMIFYFTLVWILGFMSYMRFEEELGAYPWFQVFNSFMGVVILIGLGLCSTKFKMVLAGQAKRRRELLQKLHLGQGKNVGGNKLKNDVGPAPTQIKS